MPDPGRARTLFATAPARHPLPDGPWRHLLVVDVPRQRLVLLRPRDGTRRSPSTSVSTAAAGIGGAAGSHRTPPGLHRIHARIGAGAARGHGVREPRADRRGLARRGARRTISILSRVLTLEGLEDGVNRGPGRDSLERYIYLHGTNHEEALGEPASHGCVRLGQRRRDRAVRPRGRGRPGGRCSAEVPDPRLARGRFHYAGLGGSGMSALAQFQAMRGGRASGSDRAFDRGERAEARAQLERLGIRRLAAGRQRAGRRCAALVVSTRGREQVPDYAAARRQRRAGGAPLRAARAFRRRAPHHRGHRHQRQVHRGGDGLRDPARRRARPLGHHRRRPRAAAARGPVGQRLGGRVRPAGDRGRRERRLGRALPARGGRGAQPAARPPGDGRGGRDVRDVPRAHAARRSWWGRTATSPRCRGGEVGLRLRPAGRAARQPTSTLAPRRRAPSRSTACASRCPCPGATTSRTRSPRSPPAARWAWRRPRWSRRWRASRAWAGASSRWGPRAGSRWWTTSRTTRPRSRRRWRRRRRARGGRVLAVYQPHGYGPTRFLRRRLRRDVRDRAAPRGPAVAARGVLRRRHRDARLLRRRHRRARSPRAARRAEFAPSREWLVERVAAEARAGRPGAGHGRARPVADGAGAGSAGEAGGRSAPNA